MIEQSPVARRFARVRALEALAARVEAELATERAALRRILQERPAVTNMPPSGVTPARVREWARANGLQDAVAGRGRISAAVVAAYVAAHPAGTA